MSRVIFDNQPAAPAIDTGRADVACFIGLVRLAGGAAAPRAVGKWLQGLGYGNTQIATLTNVPLPVENYATFTTLFDDGTLGGGYGTDYVAAAVRTFFSQGGKRCYVVRVDDPLTPRDSVPGSSPGQLSGKAAKLRELLLNPLYSPTDATTWTGLGALATLEEVSYVATPDLPALCASEPVGAAGQLPIIPTGPQEFTACAQGTMVPQQQWTYSAPAPRLAAGDYATWAQSVAAILNYLSGGALTHQLHLREMQYVAAFPLPQDMGVAAAAENPSADEIAQDIHGYINTFLPETVEPGVVALAPINLSSSFLQLAYPWLKTSASGALLEQLQPPDGALAGLLARDALVRGAFTSATKIVPSEIYDVEPALPPEEMKSSATALVWGAYSPQKALIERLSLFGFTPSGIALLSDVTAYPQESYRAGAVNRLVNVICRAARMIGQSAVFENNGPALWGRIQRGLQNLMTEAWTLGALDGASVSDAFSVRCDQSTMTQNDLDNGRLIAQVIFTAAALVETITVTLAIEASGTSVQAIAANSAATAVIASGGANSVLTGVN